MIESRRWDGWTKWHIWGKTELHGELGCGNLKRPFGRPTHTCKDIPIKLDGTVYNASILLRIGLCCGLL
jgi:hypothetical protein